jgi:hypothetical protein
MTGVARDTELVARIDVFLAYCLREWGAVPEIAEEWETWNDSDRLEFALEWPIREDRLKQLGGWAKQGLLTTAQRHRYDHLTAVVATHRPLLQQLLVASVAGAKGEA